MKQNKQLSIQEVYRLSVLELLEVDNENEAVAYIALKMMFDRTKIFQSEGYKTKHLQRKPEVIANFNLANLYYELSGNYDLTKGEKDRLNLGVQGLIDSGLIKLIHTDGKENYCVNLAPLYIEEDRMKYTMMTQQEIWSIFNIPCGKIKQRFALLQFAVCLFNTINSTHKCGWCSFRKMPELTGMSCVKTCQNYFSLLEQNQILYVHHSKTYKVNETGDIKTLTNVYGRLQDKQYVDSYSNSRNKKEGYNFTNNLSSTDRGKITKAYNRYIAKNYKGDILELAKQCLMYNNQPYQQRHKDQQKDMSVFDSTIVKQAQEELDNYVKDYKQEVKQKQKEKESLKQLSKKKYTSFDFLDDDYDSDPF